MSNKLSFATLTYSPYLMEPLCMKYKKMEMEVRMALNGKPFTARSTANLPFGGLGVSLVACDEYAKTLEIQVIAWTPVSFCDGRTFHEPPVALFGYRLLTVLGCEIRGR